MTEIALVGEDGAHNYVSTRSNTKYGNQISNAYTTFSRYPEIYFYEKNSVIGNGTSTSSTLGLSDARNTFIERSKGITDPNSIGTSTAFSIQPYQTHWYKEAMFMQTAFRNYKEGSNYYSLIMPKGTSTTYWVASRCIGTSEEVCGFDICCVDLGSVDAHPMCNSVSGSSYSTELLPLFPVVTINSELIKSETNGNFTVDLK